MARCEAMLNPSRPVEHNYSHMPTINTDPDFANDNLLSPENFRDRLFYELARREPRAQHRHH
jgi:hypothetical protein